MTVIDRAKAAVKNILTPRGGLVVRYRKLLADQAAAGAERAQVLAAARQRLDEWEAPKREVERLEREAFSAGLADDRAREALMAELRAHPSPAVLAFEKFVGRVEGELREPVRLIERVNRLTGERTVESDDGGARMRTGEVLVRARQALRDELLYLPDDEILRRVSALKLEILAALEGMDVSDLGEIEAAS
jgi:hypothetical protein